MKRSYFASVFVDWSVSLDSKLYELEPFCTDPPCTDQGICFDKIASNAKILIIWEIFSSELFLKQLLKQYYLLHLGAFCGKKGSRIYINFNSVFLNQVFFLEMMKTLKRTNSARRKINWLLTIIMRLAKQLLSWVNFNYWDLFCKLFSKANYLRFIVKVF